MENKFVNILRIHPTGSRYICNPPVRSTDEDFVVLTDNYEKLEEELLSNGFKNESNPKYESEFGDGFRSFRKINGGGFFSDKQENINYIVTVSKRFYGGFVFATECAKRLNITDKQDRIDLFRIVREYYELD